MPAGTIARHICIILSMVHCSLSMKLLEQFLSLMIVHILATVTYVTWLVLLVKLLLSFVRLFYCCWARSLVCLFLFIFSTFRFLLFLFISSKTINAIRSSDFSFCVIFIKIQKTSVPRNRGSTPTTLAIKYGIFCCRKSICWQLYEKSRLRLISQHHPCG